MHQERVLFPGVFQRRGFGMNYLFISDLLNLESPGEDSRRGIAVGSEYCFHLLPNDKEGEILSEMARGVCSPMLMVLPYLRDREIEHILPLLLTLSERGNLKIVVNDWGTLGILSHLIPEVPLICGRLISGQSICIKGEDSPFLSEEGKTVLSMDILDSARGNAILRNRFRVEGVCVNTTLRKINYSGGEGKIYCYPYALLSITDCCPYRGNRPSALLSYCSRPCRKGYVTLTHDTIGSEIYQRGRARFFNSFPQGKGVSLPKGDCLEFLEVP